MSAPDFTALGLAAPLAAACARLGFTAPSPIQAQAIPAVLQGRDLLALAPTGSGKTAAYALPLVQRLAAERPRAFRRVRVLVLVPTRELALQVGELFRALAGTGPGALKLSVLYGGVSVNPQMMALRGGADVVVATPGRLLDLLGRNAVRLDTVEALVLDEADRLLDLGFAAERERVLAALPPRRQNLLFSATFAPEVQALADALLRDAVRVQTQSQLAPVAGTPQPSPAQAGTPGEAGAAPAIAQRAIAVDAPRRTELLRHLLQQGGWRRVLVFVATRHATEHLARKLQERGVRAAPLHGEMSQSQRGAVLQALRQGESDVLLTTDLAARGIDIPGLEVVVNYDLPRSADDHVHRIGRTGRAGAQGLAVSFVSAANEAHWRLIEKRQGRQVPLETLPGFEPVEAAPPPPAATPGTGGIKGKRPSKKDKLRAAGLRPPPG